MIELKIWRSAQRALLSALSVLIAAPAFAQGDFFWANASSASVEELGNGLALDAVGNVFVTGSFQGTADFGRGELGSLGHNMFVAQYADDPATANRRARAPHPDRSSKQNAPRCTRTDFNTHTPDVNDLADVHRPPYRATQVHPDSQRR